MNAPPPTLRSVIAHRIKDAQKSQTPPRPDAPREIINTIKARRRAEQACRLGSVSGSGSVGGSGSIGGSGSAGGGAL